MERTEITQNHLIVDTHNAMGKEISKEDAENMLKAAKSCLDTLIGKEKSIPLSLDMQTLMKWMCGLKI